METLLTTICVIVVIAMIAFRVNTALTHIWFLFGKQDDPRYDDKPKNDGTGPIWVIVLTVIATFACFFILLYLFFQVQDAPTNPFKP